MTTGDSPLLSVRAEARQLVAPDYAVVDGLIEHTARSKVSSSRPNWSGWKSSRCANANPTIEAP